MNEYIRLLEIVKNRMEIREDSFGSVIAAKIHNREEFDLMISFWTIIFFLMKGLFLFHALNF